MHGGRHPRFTFCQIWLSFFFKVIGYLYSFSEKNLSIMLLIIFLVQNLRQIWLGVQSSDFRILRVLYLSTWTDRYVFATNQGPVVQSIVSLTSSLRVISLTVLADSIYNILIFFAEKM